MAAGSEKENLVYVGFWRRALAFTIDSLAWLIAPSFLLGNVFGEFVADSAEAAVAVTVVWASLWFNYFAFCEWRWGQTIGKAATSIEVRSLDGAEKLSFGQASIRGFLRLIDAWVIGWIMIAATARKQRIGDKAAKTVVARKPRRAAAARAAAAGAGAGAAATGAGAVAGAGAAAVGPPAAPRRQPAAPPPPAPEFADSPYVQGTRWSDPPPEPASVESGPRGRLPSIDWTLRTTVLGLIGGFVASIFVPLLVLPFDPDLDSDGALLAAQALFGATLIGVAVGIASGWDLGSVRDGLRRLGLRGFSPSAFGWMAAVLVGYYIAAGLFASFVLEPEQEDIGGELGACGSSIADILIPVGLIVVLAPISEELFFRGFLFSGLRSRLSLWPAALIAGAVFGLVHAPTGITTVIPLAALGVGLCWLYERTGSLWPSIFAHTINNALALTLICNTSAG